MKKALIWFFASCALLTADDDSFRERFADPATREAALAELIPGTDEAYFHTALHHQLAGRETEFRKVIADWKAARKDTDDPFYAPPVGLSVLENRQVLLDYEKRPQASIDELIRKLGLKFDDSRPDAEAAAASLPTRLDPALISETEFEKAAAQKSPQQPYKQYHGSRMQRELEKVKKFDDHQVRWFFEKIDRADLPGVVPLVKRMLDLEKKELSFTDQRLLRQLSSSQLVELEKLHPKLHGNTSFNIAFLGKLMPGVETDFKRDLKAHAAHLERCRGYVFKLPPTQNTLKAHVLFHHLRLQRELGNFPKQDFLAYLALPRSQHVLLITPKTPAPNCILREVDFVAATGCSPLMNDNVIINSYLRHFLSQSDSAKDFAPYVQEKVLIPLHAESRLLAGENPERWGKLLDPADFKALQQDIRIAFAPGAPGELNSDASVALGVDLKNTPKLLIRIYELDLPSHLARHNSLPDANIALDGLVPHHERQLTFTQSPMILHREHIELPELSGPGTWLVDFVSGQASARALIRKGQLTTYLARTVTGQTIHVFDEKGQPVPKARLSLGRESLTANASGVITIPNAPNQAVTSGIVEAGKLATRVKLDTRSDELALDTRFFLAREQLLADQNAELRLRLRLTNHGFEIPLDRIKDPAIVLKAELLGGLTTERVIAKNLKLEPTLEIPFQVPADLLKLTLTVRGAVTPTTGGDPVKLHGSASYEINGDLKAARIGTGFFSPTASGHRLEVRGRNGEPLAFRSIALSCARDGYARDVTVHLRTDKNGRIDLGTLDGIEGVTATGTDIANTYYAIYPRLLDFAAEIHRLAGQKIILPLEKPAAAPDRMELSLIEKRGSQVVRDHFDKLAIVDGQIVIRNLPAGDYTFTQVGQETEIRVIDGAESDGLLVSKSRILPRQVPHNPTIASAKATDDKLKIQLRDFGPNTRVSIVGKRYHHDDWDDGLGIYPFAPPISGRLTRGFVTCDFLVGRRLDDEMRYILDRRSARTFPGSMLPRPGLLLNRWSEEDIDQSDLDEYGGGRGRSGFASIPSAMRKRGAGDPRGIATDSALSATCDFLGMPAVVKFDLKPAADGSITLPLGDFIGSQFLEITAADAFADDTQIVPLAASDAPVRDRRIARPLDAKSHHLATRSAAVLRKGATASIENLLDADWRAFTTLADAHQFLYGMVPDERVRDFVFLPEWPGFDEKQKLKLLSDHACHEFHLFLARKDKAFFEKHVKPMLAQKPEPQFIDDLLLGRDLKSYLRPYAWQRLNAAEKALLAQALPDAQKRIARELALRWELEAPSPEVETVLFTQTLRGTDLAQQDSLGLASNELRSQISSGNAYLTDKLRRIIIPSINFENTSVEEAVEFLAQRACELDSLELDPTKKGINFVVRRPRGHAGSDPGLGDALGGDPGSLRIPELRLRNVPISVALKYICDATKLRYKVDNYAVTLVPQTETGEDIMTRSFTVPPDFRASMSNDGNEPNPFDPPNSSSNAIQPLPPIMDLLKQAGISFPEGSSATLTGNTLLVSNTPIELDKVESLTESIACMNPAGGRQERASGFGSGYTSQLNPFESKNEVDAFEAPPVLPRFAERSKRWREANYYHHPYSTDEELIPLNHFWIDLAAWDGKGEFLSPHFNACNRSANEALMCLALLDLPFNAERPEVTVDGSTLRVKAREPMLLFYKDTRRSDEVAKASPLLLRQSFCPLRDKFRIVDGQQVENSVTGDFRPGVPYSASLIVTNPTGTGRRIDLLAQIPAGSIPLFGKPATLSTTLEIEPHGVLMQELVFYFPSIGDYSVYPLHISEHGKILAHTEAQTLPVSNDPEALDAASWWVLASDGSNEEVYKRLRSENLNAINLDAISWRMKDKEVFLKVSEILRERMFFSRDIAAYGFHHRDLSSINTYLENSDAIQQLGMWLDSPLLKIRPRTHHDWETLEFDPLINPRAHRFGDNPRMGHEEARAHYQAFLDQLAWKPKLDASDQLTFTAYLFLQDRIEEALARFPKIDPAELPGSVNYDYLHAVALFYQEKPAEAKAIAAATLPTLPPGIWRERFEAVVSQADEIVKLDMPDLTEPAKETLIAPQLDITLADHGKLTLKHRGLDKATLRFFSVDLEMLFSKDPFLKGEGGNAYPSIRPNETLEVSLSKEAAETTIELPKPLQQGNLLVAAESGSTKLLRLLDSNALEIQQSPLDRTVQVLDATSHKPLVKAYIKVYAEHRDGTIVFHKDGYTDLRGKFDYLSHTGVDASEIKRVAILVSHPEKGARTVSYYR